MILSKAYFPSVILIQNVRFIRSGWSIDYPDGKKRDRAIYIQEGKTKQHYLTLEKLNQNLEQGTIKI